MSVAFVAERAKGTTALKNYTIPVSGTTTGNFLSLAIAVNAGSVTTVSTVTDDVGTVWTIDKAVASSASTKGIVFASAIVGLIAPSTISVGLSTTTSSTYKVEEFSGVARAASFDVGNSAVNSAGTAATCGTIAPGAGVGDLILAGFATNVAQSSFTPAAGYTQAGTPNNTSLDLCLEYKLSGAASESGGGTYASSVSTVTVGGIVSYKALIPTKYGVHSELQAQSNGEIDARFADALDCGASFIRVGLQWSRVRAGASDPGVYDWTLYDYMVAKSAATGVGLLFVLWQSPQWANGSASDGSIVPNAGSGSADGTFQTWAAAYATFCADSTARYKAGGAGNLSSASIMWEIWDEPNLRGWWHNAANNAGPDAAQYSYTYAAARTAMIAQDANAHIITGGLSSWTTAGANDVAGKTFLAQLITDTRVMPFVGYHPYTSSGGPTFHDASTKNNFDDLADMRRTLDAGGYSASKISATEFGWDSVSVTTATQATYVKQALTIIDRRYQDWCDLCCVYTLTDGDGGSSSGLYTSGHVIKAAGTAFKSFRAGSFTQSYGASGLSTKAGRFALNTSTGAQSITGVGFKPKAIIFTATALNTADGYTDSTSWCYGISDGITDRSLAGWSIDNVATTAPGCLMYAAIGGMSGATTTSFAFNVTSLDSDGFTINLTTAPASGWLVTYMAIGGSDISRAVVGDFCWRNNTGTGYGLAEVGFAPDLFLFGATGQLSNTASLPAGASDTTDIFVAAMDNALGIGSHSATYQTRGAPATAQAHSSYQTSLLYPGITPTSIGATGPVVTLASAPGSNLPMFFLALKGGKWKVLSDTQKATTGTQAKTGAGFLPTALMTLGSQLTAVSANAGDGDLQIGVYDGTNSYAVWGGGVTNVNPANQATRIISGKVISHSTAAATTNAEASVSSLDADGYTLNWSTADATARKFTSIVGARSSLATTSPGGRRLRTSPAQFLEMMEGKQ